MSFEDAALTERCFLARSGRPTAALATSNVSERLPEKYANEVSPVSLVSGEGEGVRIASVLHPHRHPQPHPPLPLTLHIHPLTLTLTLTLTLKSNQIFLLTCTDFNVINVPEFDISHYYQIGWWGGLATKTLPGGVAHGEAELEQLRLMKGLKAPVGRLELRALVASS